MRHLAFGLGLALGLPAHAATIVLDFEEETPDIYDDFVSTECGGCVQFFGRSTGDLQVWVNDFVGGQSDGRGLGQYGDDSSDSLRMDFPTPILGISLAFGNDDPEELTIADEAILEAFLDGVKVGETRVFVNANDLMDQTIELTEVGPFDRVLFGYTGAIDEVVDNLILQTPEPGTLGLGAVAAASLLASSRRRPGAS